MVPPLPLFADQRADAVQVLALVTRLVAMVQEAQVTFAIDDDRARHAGHVVHTAHLAVLVIQHGEAHGRLLQPVVRGLRVRLDIHTDQGEAQLVVLLVNVLEQGHFLAARSAPARPEVEHDHLALVLRQVDLAATLGG